MKEMEAGSTLRSLLSLHICSHLVFSDVISQKMPELIEELSWVAEHKRLMSSFLEIECDF